MLAHWAILIQRMLADPNINEECVKCVEIFFMVAITLIFCERLISHMDFRTKTLYSLLFSLSVS